ncbi:type VI secretion system ImpA family N-terminal domain-containing protein [Vibrio litoralis]|uniref:type VI secretion system ImpA family N-terminal domain-containing protein n=1 Tax=Vibrio litoralis TaxID=335972 RepID=UPI00047FC9BC|nr:type VI secretion system ImpA family N-terminal domain-containing protein [Vibrio litoralis]
MSSCVYIEHRVFNLVSDSSALRKNHIYDDVKAEINKQNSPFSGGTDWEAVKKKCTLLSEKSGIDLLLCCYYTVATTKLNGIVGLANGLELLLSSLIVSTKDLKNAHKRKELIDWVNSCIIKEIKLLKPNYEMLRDLYRCERHCEQIDQIFTEKQPEFVANMDGIAYVIFEHIDRLEIQYKSKQKVAEISPPSEQKVAVKWHYYVLALLLTSFVAYQFLSPPNRLNPTLYIQSNALPEKPLDQQQREALNHYISNMANNSLAWLGETPNRQNENIKKLEFLLGDEERIALLRQQWLVERKESIEAVNEMVNKFDSVRTQLSNVNLGIQKTHLNSLKSEMNSVTKVGKSLSPIYARVGYIEQLLKTGDNEKAAKELAILQQRLNALIWKVDQLEELVVYPSDFKMQNSELSSKSLGKKDWRRNVGHLSNQSDAA